MRSDDVRSSLDLLDRVIGEFDDGLLSSTDSESPVGHQLQFGRSTRFFDQDDNNESQIEANIRLLPPPKGKQRNPGGQLNVQNRRTLSDQVDDIFSELNQELYADKSSALPRRPPAALSPKNDSTSQWVALHRQRSPVRRMDDPLPSPPLLLKGKKSGAKARNEVVVCTTEKQEVFSLKKSVKAQVHSLEAKTRNSPGVGAKQPSRRSKSENPPLIRRDNINQPPPMPEKTKIHLKNTKSIEINSASQVHNGFEKTKKSAQNSIAGKSSKINNFELNESRKTPNPEFRQQQFKRARSVGPVVEAGQRELSKLDLTKVLPGAINPASILKERKSRSRARTENNSNGLSNTQSKTRLEGSQVTQGKSDSFITDRKQMNPTLGAATPDSTPRNTANKMPERQKSMIDLREPFWPEQPARRLVHPIQYGRIPATSAGPPQNPRNISALARSATEHDIRLRSNRAMPTFNDLPPHIQQHLIRHHGLCGAGMDPSSLGCKGCIDPQSYAMRQSNLETQRELLIRRGFSPTHPYISGEIPIHPELQGQLPFNVPSRTIPLRLEDYHRFKPELWLQDHNPNPVSFSDLAVLHNELELRRRREIYRQNSQRRHGSVADIGGNNFTSLPWDEIVPRRQMEQFQHQLQQHVVEQQQKHQIIVQQQKNKSVESRRKNHPFGVFQNSGWFNPMNQVLRQDEASETVSNSRMKKQGQWVLKERSVDQMQSMPPFFPVATLKDSGISEDQEIFTRSGATRSSFGMALKDKFQRNPNMYFPPDGQTNRASSSSSSGGNNTKRRSMASKSTTIDDLSDTDTLIHNMSDGSFEKDRTSLGSAEQHSLGSPFGHGSRSSGNSSLSPQNSMEGSPKMIPKQAPKFKFAASALQGGPKSLSSSDILGVSFNKKTIRNYTPKESCTMLREFEDRRNNSFDLGEKERASSQPSFSGSGHMGATTRPSSRPSSTSHELKNIQVEKKRFVGNTRNEENVDCHLGKGLSGDKSSMERMIEDFHKSLPPPPVDGRQQKPKGRNGESGDYAIKAASTAAASKRTPKHGTLTSQMSNWSAASSVASFDYQPARQKSDLSLPALKEVEFNSNGTSETPMRSRNQTPKGERVPPEGASADSPRSFFQLLEVDEKKVDKQKPKALSALDLLESSSPAVDNDEFSNLRKLIFEGRIAGLSERPPNFIPPTPPTSNRKGLERKDSPGLDKNPSRLTTNRPRKSREAPKPPATNQESTPFPGKSSQQTDIKLINSHRRESLEDLTQMGTRRRGSDNEKIKRSSSNHGNLSNGFDLLNLNVETTAAQLIADSTEKKFNFNPFKNMWKKKNYSFDFN